MSSLPVSTPADADGRCSQDEDLLLAAAVLRGDAGAREEFVRRMRSVSRFVAALNQQYGGVLDHHDLADLTQDSLLIIWRKLPEFGGPGNLLGWAYSIAAREFLSRRRARWRNRERGEEPDAPLARAPEESPPEELDWAVLQSLERLDPLDQRILTLRHEAALTFGEIGAELGLPENTAKTRYRRAILRLRELVRVVRREKETGA